MGATWSNQQLWFKKKSTCHQAASAWNLKNQACGHWPSWVGWLRKEVNFSLETTRVRVAETPASLDVGCCIPLVPTPGWGFRTLMIRLTTSNEVTNVLRSKMVCTFQKRAQTKHISWIRTSLMSNRTEEFQAYFGGLSLSLSLSFWWPTFLVPTYAHIIISAYQDNLACTCYHVGIVARFPWMIPEGSHVLGCFWL